MNTHSHNTGKFDADAREHRLIWHVEKPSESANDNEQTDLSIHADERVENIAENVNNASGYNLDFDFSDVEYTPTKREEPKPLIRGSRAHLLEAIDEGPLTKERFADAQAWLVSNNTNLKVSGSNLLPYVIKRRGRPTTDEFHNQFADPYEIDWDRFQRDRGLKSEVLATDEKEDKSAEGTVEGSDPKYEKPPTNNDDETAKPKEKESNEKKEEKESSFLMEILALIMEYMGRMRSGSVFNVHEFTQNRQTGRQLRLIEMRLGEIGTQLGNPSTSKQHRAQLLQQQKDLTKQYEALRAKIKEQKRKQEQQAENGGQRRNEFVARKRRPSGSEGNSEGGSEHASQEEKLRSFMKYMERVERGDVEMDKEEYTIFMKEIISFLSPQEVQEMMRDMAQVFNNGEFRTYMEQFGLSSEESDDALFEALEAINAVLPDVGIGYRFVIEDDSTVSVSRGGARSGRRSKGKHQRETASEKSNGDEEHEDKEKQKEDTEQQPSGGYTEFIPMMEFHKNKLIPVTVPAAIMDKIGMGNKEHVLLIKQVSKGKFTVPRTLRDVRTMGSFDPERWSTAESADQIIADLIGLKIKHVRGGVEISIPKKWVWSSGSGEYTNGPPIKLNGSSVVSDRLRNSPYFFG